MDELHLSVMIAAAHRAGRLIRRHFGRVRTFEQKGSAIDPVTEIDRRAQALILETLQAAFPDYGILAEEDPQPPPQNSPYWVIDPLDGTTNFIHGYPMVAVSIALAEGKTVQAGVVYNPIARELFTAVQGKGAWLNGKPINVSDTRSLAEALLASGFPYNAWENSDNNTQEWARVLRHVVSLRSDGSAALDLCHVACGRLDGYWEIDLDPWDMAAGSLIVQEAGGQVTDLSGDPFTFHGRSILVSNGHIHKEMLAILRQARYGRG